VHPLVLGHRQQESGFESFARGMKLRFLANPFEKLDQETLMEILERLRYWKEELW
jgi:hypothetical protein